MGGWGSADFTGGFTSATQDGGNTWKNANEIGKFLNRFRFFGSPVSVGYASGDTVYKYSAEPAMSAIARASRPRALLPQAQLVSAALPIAIPMEVPAGTKRLTLHVWDRFGVDVGCVLDEIRPKSGSRIFAWDGTGADGNVVPAGNYIVRLTADDAVASSIVTHRSAPRGFASAAAAAPARMRVLSANLRSDRPTTVAALMRQAPPARDLRWLQDALQMAIQLELATLPPYLTARWTIEPLLDPAAKSIFEIRREEMLHFGLACNLLVAIGKLPVIADASVVPTYPGPLPGGVRPGLVVSLRRFSREQAGVFMEIEFPQDGPIATAAISETFNSIGQFYAAILSAFQALNPPLDMSLQIEDSSVGLFKIDTVANVKTAIDLINLQGEGSNVSPEEKPGDLAHYYRFGELHHGKRLVQDPASGKWTFTGADVPLPTVMPMADIPVGGYQKADVPDPATWDLIATFDNQYSEMLRTLQSAWQHGDSVLLNDSVDLMRQMGLTGRKLVRTPIPGRGENYGPCFRYVPPASP